MNEHRRRAWLQAQTRWSLRKIMPSALPFQVPAGGRYCRSAVFTMYLPPQLVDPEVVRDSLGEVFGILWPDGWGLTAYGVNVKGWPYLVRFGSLGPICLLANEMRREALANLRQAWAKIVGSGHAQVRMRPCRDEVDVSRFAVLARLNAPVPLPFFLRKVAEYRRSLAKKARGKQHPDVQLRIRAANRKSAQKVAVGLASDLAGAGVRFACLVPSPAEIEPNPILIRRVLVRTWQPA